MRKGRRISRFSLAGRPFSAQAAELGQKPQCAVELTEVRTSDRDRWALGFEATGPDDLPAAHYRPPQRSYSPSEILGEQGCNTYMVGKWVVGVWALGARTCA